jgi:putative intracellular protease/amidase
MKNLRRLCILLIAGLMPTAYAQNSPKILMIVNEGFWAPEHFKPRELFEKAGFQITVAAKNVGKISPDARNTDYKPVIATVAFSEVDVSKYDAIIFAGGNGAWTDYFPNEHAHRILKQSLESGKITGLICSSTGLLGVAYNFDGQTPLIPGRKVTGYYRVRALLEKVGAASYSEGLEGKPHVVVDEKLITGRDPISSELFGETLLKVIQENKNQNFKKAAL